ncbi:fimbrial protein, partial [Staphylococcus aureus]|uniref:fimbrial protein n=1 Tax=Staphylococcus aureus TaxID=1280 RepID=UPI003D22DF58
IQMSTTNLARFNGIDSTSGETSFVIRINNCPAGFNRIRYELHPAQRPVSGMPGTLQPAPGATASGIGVKVADEGGRAAPFEISLPLTDYDRSTGGSYAIRMSASYIQTAPIMQPGLVNAMMVVLLNYL